jgi:uncharacterized protein YdeI (YjbR/CyaY-like superfamily)
MDIRAITFKSSDEWRDWLSQNHDKEKEAWLILYKKESGKGGMSYSEALEEALCFGWVDGKIQRIDDEKFALRFSPRKPRSGWSKRNREKAELLIAQGRMTDTGMARIEEAKRNGVWEKAYSSSTAETMPADLESALSGNRTALHNFNNMANTYRNMFIRWLNRADNEEIRKQRVEEIVKRAERNIKVRYGKI